MPIRTYETNTKDRKCEHCRHDAGAFTNYEWRRFELLLCEGCRKLNLYPRIQARDEATMTKADYLQKYYGFDEEVAKLWCLGHYLLKLDGICPECEAERIQENRDRNEEARGE